MAGVICRHYVLLVTKILVDFDGCVSKYTPRIEVPWGMGNERHFLESLSIKGSYIIESYRLKMKLGLIIIY